MTRDANQIAQEAARREEKSWRSDLQPPKPAVTKVPKPNRGTLSVWRDGIADEPRSTHYPNVTVRLDNPNVIIMGSEEGSTYLLYPEPGWYCEFIPNDEG